MSRFFSEKYEKLTAYTPGEQPRNMECIKLNTNESPFPPSDGVLAAVQAEAGKLQLYSDPDCRSLIDRLAGRYGVKPSQVIATNGSDEVLNFAFMAFSDEKRPLAFPDLTYGFYPVFAQLNNLPYEEIPLKEDFAIDPADYIGIGKNIVIANPNAPTGICLGLDQIEKIVAGNPDNVVIVDEAYVDFGGESAVSLVDKYDNLLVTRTFSKSRSLAGGRLGFGIGQESLISDLHTIRFSTNPYNVNRMTMAAGCAALDEDEYYMANCKTIVKNRTWTTRELEKRGFFVLPSSTNFVFARTNRLAGGKLYEELKKRNVLVRHFNKERIADFNRITIGSMAQMEALMAAVDEIFKEAQV